MYFSYSLTYAILSLCLKMIARVVIETLQIKFLLSTVTVQDVLPELVYHSYNFEMDTEKQRQRRRDDARLTESRNARSEQLNTRGAYRVANQRSLPCLSGSERRKPGWFLDMKYQTCLIR